MSTSSPTREPAEPIDPERLGVSRRTPHVTMDLAYLLAQRYEAEATDVGIEVRSLTDGRRALLAYSSLERLVHLCGRAQPWAAVEPGRVHEVQLAVAADVVLWDLELPVEHRHHEEQ